jgi:hypothetical protein
MMICFAPDALVALHLHAVTVALGNASSASKIPKLQPFLSSGMKEILGLKRIGTDAGDLHRIKILKLGLAWYVENEYAINVDLNATNAIAELVLTAKMQMI